MWIVFYSRRLEAVRQACSGAPLRRCADNDGGGHALFGAAKFKRVEAEMVRRRRLARSSLWTIAGSCLAVGNESVCHAQLTTPVIQPLLNFNYSRGNNTSVNERARPEYTSVGIQAGGFTVFPTLNLGIGYTSNLYGTDSFKRGSAYYEATPQVRAVSNWSRHNLEFDAGGDLLRYTRSSIANQNGWNVSGKGRLDVGSNSTLTFAGSTANTYDARLNGATPANTSSPAPYQSSRVSLSGVNVAGRFRFSVVGSYSSGEFGSIRLFDGTTVSQKFRNEQALGIASRVDYALGPNVSLFGQFGYTDTSYDRKFSTGQNFRSSRDYAGLVGVAMDLTALIRGSLAVGYDRRKYQSALYKPVAGLSFEAKIEYFPSELTTFTLIGRRIVEDASIPGSSGYFNTGGGVRIDHEFLRNLIANAGVSYEQANYRGIVSKANIVRASAGLRYLVSRSVGIGMRVEYASRDNSGVLVGATLHQTSGLLSLYLQK